MSQLERLRSAQTLRDLAIILHVKPSRLSYLLYYTPEESKYSQFEIPKKFGGKRTISAPVAALKEVQKKLSVLLQECIAEINVKNNFVNTVSHGFVKDRSIITNATLHRNRRYVFNVDIENFFGSINFGRVYGFFIKDNNFLLKSRIAAVIAKIACFENVLPQGSPCSPVISNLIGGILDSHLIKLGKSSGCTYSRYADDITFSTNQHNFPETIAKKLMPESNKWYAGDELARLIRLSGFSLNQGKIRMQYFDSRQEVTGLIVNKKLNVISDYRKTVRAMTHSALSSGEFFVKYKTQLPEGGEAVNHAPGSLEQLHGMLGFIHSIDSFNKKKLKGDAKKDLQIKDSAFKQFLICKEFIACKKPTIICEGKTDNVYLTHAVRGLAAKYPQLATIGDSGKISLNLRLFKYTGTNTGRILNLTGGYKDLCKLIKSYHDMFDKYPSQLNESKNPVIILIDNDSAVPPIRDAIKGIAKVIATEGATFWHVVGNLYVMPTPLFAGQAESCIEDFFDDKTRAIKLDGRSFDPGKDIDSATNYGKAEFAYKVVAKQADVIDFSLFEAILNNVDAIISDYASKGNPEVIL